MPSANLDLVRSLYAAWRHGDWSSAEWADPEIEFGSNDPMLRLDRTAGGPEMGESWRSWLQVWKDFYTEAEEYRELDGERVLVLLRYGGRGNPGGLEVTPIEGASLFHIHDGRVTRLLLYLDRERARADAGLSPESDVADAG